MIGLYRKYGIRVFKIDGLTIPTKRAEVNLRNLFDKVLAETGDKVMFNLDATASRRAGYHFSVNMEISSLRTDIPTGEIITLIGRFAIYGCLLNMFRLKSYR